MIEIQITEEMKETAQRKSREMGAIRNSILKGSGNFVGFLGEEIVNSVLGGTIKNTRDYDLIHNGLKYDVKTKRCTSPPKPYYECSIAGFNTRQKCDRYFFVRIECNRVSNEPVTAWLLGWYDKKEYFNFARKLTKGQRDGDNGFVVKADCFNLSIEALKTVKDLLDDELSQFILVDHEEKDWWTIENRAFEDQKPIDVLEHSPERLFGMIENIKSGRPG